MSSKECKIIDLSLISGSADVFRTAIGGYWDIVSSSEGEELNFSAVGQLGESPFKNISSTFSAHIKKIGANTSQIEVINEDVIIPNYKVPLRVASTEDVSSDTYWKALFKGGVVDEEKVTPIYTERLFNYCYLTMSKPYPKIDAAKISGASISNQIQISYEYNNYIPRYQDYISNFQSVLKIPNYYILTDLQTADLTTDTDLYDSEIISSITLHGEVEGATSLFKLDSTALEQVGIDSTQLSGDLRKKLNKSYTYLSTDYLSYSLMNNTLSSSTVDYLNKKLQNVIIDNTAFNKLYKEQLVGSEYTRTKFPFYTKITFPVSTTVDGFVKSINSANYSSRFLKTLKESFSGEIPSKRLTPVDKPVSVNCTYISSSEDTDVDTDVTETKETNYRAIDYIDMLVYMRNNYKTISDNCHFVGEKNIYRIAANSPSSSYRYVNSLGSLSILNDTIEFLNNTANYNSEYPLDLLFSNNISYSETIAYRIEKVGGIASGDLRTQKTLQNYWFMNTDAVAELDFIDTQVKYGENYTYTVYAYVLAVGSKYKFSDLSLSRQLCLLDDSDDYGLELYNPDTGGTMDTLFPATALPGDIATDAQIQSATPYVAEFYLNYEPSVELIEIPLYTKTLKILDYPSNSTNVFPYQHLDASQKIGFGLYYESFLQKVVPTAISSADSQLLEDYMNANDLLKNSKITNKSVSRPRYVEVYRIEEAPTGYTDFENHLITTLDLKEKDTIIPRTSAGAIAPHETFTFTNIFYDEKIRTNKKYYYLFRILNEQRSLAHLSEIYEAQLVNDGGFNYSLFDVFYESDLEKNVFVKPSKNVKKLIQLQPNLQQLTLDTSGVDFDDDAYTQLSNVVVGSADDLIWGKTFKVRLTSKKTGKKIDLNITYKLNSEI